MCVCVCVRERERERESNYLSNVFVFCFGCGLLCTLRLWTNLSKCLWWLCKRRCLCWHVWCTWFLFLFSLFLAQRNKLSWEYPLMVNHWTSWFLSCACDCFFRVCFVEWIRTSPLRSIISTPNPNLAHEHKYPTWDLVGLGQHCILFSTFLG